MKSIQVMTADELRSEMQGYLKGKPRERWRRIGWGRSTLRNVTFNADGTVEYVGSERAALQALVGRHRKIKENRSAGAKRAAETRRIRKEAMVYEVVEHWLVTGKFPGPSLKCSICGRKLSDPAAIEHGIGSECWQEFLSVVDQYE